MISRSIAMAASAAVLAWAATVAWAQQNVDIIPIYRNYIASNAAAGKCNALDETSEQSFVENLSTVSAQAAQALQDRTPGASRAEVLSQLKVIREEARDMALVEVRNSGCGSPEVQRLIQLYKAHAEGRP